MTKLFLHCGAHRATEDKIKNSFTPPGERLDGKRPFIPIPHYDLFSLIRDEASNVGLVVDEVEHALQDAGPIKDAIYFGALRLKSRVGDFSTMVGIRNSHAKTLAAGIVVGNYVFVCDNLCFSGEIQIGRKHTKNLLMDLPKLVSDAMLRVVKLQDFQDERVEVYRNHQITDDYAIRLLTHMSMEYDILPWGNVRNAIQEWVEPSHEEHLQWGRSVWRLQQAVTEVMKPGDLRNQDRLHGRGRRANAVIWDNPDRTIKMHLLLDQVCEIQGFDA